MPLPLLAAGAGLALFNTGKRFISGIGQKKESKKINPIFNQYQRSPLAGQQLDFAKQAFADPSFGTRGDTTRNIFSNNANFLDSVNRNATDSSQALALGAAGLGQTNQDLMNSNLGFMNNKAAMLQNLNQAYGVNIDETDKEYQSMLQKYQMDAQRKDALRNAGEQNQYGSISDLSSMAFTLGTGGFGNIFGNKRIPSPNNTPASTIPSSIPNIGLNMQNRGLYPRRTP